MPSNLPFMPLFHDAFRSATAKWSDAEVGAYARLLLQQWDKEHVKPVEVAGLIAIQGDSLALVLSKFYLGPDGCLRNARCAAERAKAIAKSEKLSKAGRRGGSRTQARLHLERQENPQARLNYSELHSELDLDSSPGSGARAGEGSQASGDEPSPTAPGVPVNRCALALLAAMEHSNGLTYAKPGPELVAAQNAIGKLVSQGATEARIMAAVANIASGVWRTPVTNPAYFASDFPKIEAAGRPPPGPPPAKPMSDAATEIMFGREFKELAEYQRERARNA